MRNTLEQFFAKPRTLYDNIAFSDPKLQRGLVWCTRCDRELAVDVVKCLRAGWPRCHGATMSIDSPSERKTACQERDRRLQREVK